ncbi:MAG: hypothetical protein ACYDBB_18855 [Armatimonadota bacterium]
MKLKLAGFYKELSYGIDYNGSIQSIVQTMPGMNDELIVKYLHEGVLFAVSPGIVYDVLSNEEIAIGTRAILTDGVWAWTAELDYYVKEYHISLPCDFISHMRDNDWKIPNDIDISKLSL